VTGDGVIHSELCSGTIEHAKSDRGKGEEIHAGKGFAMVAKKTDPSPGGFRISGRSLYPARDGSLGQVKAEHKQFAVNARSAPSRILRNHLEDEISDLLRNRLSAHSLPRPGDQTPVQAKASSVPANYGLGSDEDERFVPAGPEPPSSDPEKLVQGAESRSEMASRQHHELLPKGEIFQNQGLRSAKETNESSEPESGKGKHGECYSRSPPSLGCSFQKPHRIVARDTSISTVPFPGPPHERILVP
jgi:hypothetical protein